MAIRVPIVSEFVDKGIKSAIKEFESLEGPAQKAGFVLEQAFLPATAALGGLAFAGLNFAKVAAEDEESANRLAGQLRRSTGATEENVAAVEAQIAAMEMASGVADLDLRQSLGRLVSQTGDTEEAFEGLDLALDIAAATGKPLQTVTEALARAYGGNEQALKRLDPQMEALIKDGAELDDVLDGMRSTFGGANEEMMAGATGGFRRMQLQIDNTKEAIGFAVLPLITAFLPALQRLAELGQENAEIIARVGMVVGGLAAAIVAINIVMKAFATIMAVVKGVTLLFNLVLAANPIVLITLAVIALIAILIALEKRFGFLSAIVRGIGELFAGFRRLATNVFERIFDAVRSFAGRLEGIGKRIFFFLTLPFQLWFRLVRGIINGDILDLVRDLPNKLRQFVNAIRDRLAGPFNAARDRITNAFNQVRDRIRNRINSVVGFVRRIPGNIRDAVLRARDRLVLAFTQVRDRIRARIQSVVDRIRRVPANIRSAALAVRDRLVLAFTQVRDRIRDRIDAVVGFARGIPGRIAAFANTIRDALAAPFNAARDRITDGIDGIIEFVSALPRRIAGAATGMFNGFWTAFRNIINRIIRAWNGLSFTIPSISIPFTNISSPSFTVGTPNIPLIPLAEGGIVLGPTPALIGEAGPEAVIPLDGRHGLGQTVVVNVAGSVVSEADLIETVRRGLVESQRSGRRLAI